MKLYVWNNPYRVDYGGSCLYVVAESEEQARAMATARVGISKYGDTPLEYDLGDMKKLGKPTRILDVPCAEIYEWSE